LLKHAPALRPAMDQRCTRPMPCGGETILPDPGQGGPKPRPVGADLVRGRAEGERPKGDLPACSGREAGLVWTVRAVGRSAIRTRASARVGACGRTRPHMNREREGVRRNLARQAAVDAY
jgi:hypothetical protein